MVTCWNLVSGHQSFGGIQCLHLQAYGHLNPEGTVVHTYQITTCRHNPEAHKMNLHRSESSNSRTNISAILTETFRGFPQSFQVSVGITYQIMPRTLPSTSFQVIIKPSNHSKL
jgi:hypothetical protein